MLCHICVLLLVSSYAFGKEIQENQPLQNEFPRKCYTLLGCFETGPPYFHRHLRPISLLPFDEEHIQTKFHLFTVWNPVEPQNLAPTNDVVQRSFFVPYAKTKIIIPGFMSVVKKGDYTYMMKDALLSRGPYNVIIVNWTDSNQNPYPQAVANARVVAAQVAQMINALQIFAGARQQDFHIIGHSLGAHLAGWAGERFLSIGRITGLDPSGPYFYNASREVRLDDTDAIFVDVIHTNAANNASEGLGIEEPIGHADFYPNGGNKQPGCEYDKREGEEEPEDKEEEEPKDEEEEPEKEEDVEYERIPELEYQPEAERLVVVENITIDIGNNPEAAPFQKHFCDHFRAVSFLITSILDDRCHFESMPCENTDSYLRGDCSAHFSRRPITVEMGIRAVKSVYTQPGQRFYLNTTDKAPFCLQSDGIRWWSVTRITHVHW